MSTTDDQYSVPLTLPLTGPGSRAQIAAYVREAIEHANPGNAARLAENITTSVLSRLGASHLTASFGAEAEILGRLLVLRDQLVTATNLPGIVFVVPRGMLEGYAARTQRHMDAYDGIEIIYADVDRPMVAIPATP
jgi:hypothetical protein